MNDFERLRTVRDELADMIEDPQNGFGAEVPDRGLDMNQGTADLAFALRGTRYEITIRRLP